MVLFDMDGLLLDIERVCMQCCIELGREYGLPDMTDVFVRIIGLRGAESRPILETALRGSVDHDTFVKRWDALIDARLRTGVPLKAGAVELLQHLDREGLRTAVATSTRTETTRKHLKAAGLFGFFDVVIGGDQVSNGKPDPEIYHKAADAIGVRAKDCIIFEDSDPGVLAAVQSGARVVQIPDIKQPSPETLALGHIIAPNLVAGARLVGLT
ncbi:MAG: HAD family phosphatase [Paracoccaceae bacterium]